jgi:hypothetical protein
MGRWGIGTVCYAIFALLGCGSNEEEVTREKVDGVWVFYYSPDGHNDALNQGMATIEDGCLLVAGSVVVWFRKDSDAVAGLVRDIRNGDHPTVRVGGGEAGPGAELTRVVSEVCPDREVWFGAPL